MKSCLCEICFSQFKTQEGKEHHRENNKHKIYEFRELVFQNSKNYFIFEKLNFISRKHDALYGLVTLRKSCVKGEVIGNVFKKSRVYFSSNELNKKLENKSLEILSEFELKNLEKYVKKFV